MKSELGEPVGPNSDVKSATSRRTRFGGRSYDRVEWDDLIRRHELYLAIVIFIYFFVTFLVGLLSIFGHTNNGYSSEIRHREFHGGIWQFCKQETRSSSPKCQSVTQDLLSKTNQLSLWGDDWGSYVAARAFLIVAHLYNLPLMLVPLIILCKKLYNLYLFCGMTLAGIALFVWFITVAAITTTLFDDNGPDEHNAGWSVSSLWMCMILCILIVFLPILMCCVARRIEEMQREDAKQNYEPILENNIDVDVRVEHYE